MFQEDSLNVRTNPLASHGGLTVNAVEEWEPRGLKLMRDVLTSRRFILVALSEAGMIHLDGDQGDSCLMHRGGITRCGDMPNGGRVATGDDG